MKKAVVITGVLALTLLALWASPSSISQAALSFFAEDDPDVPRLWKNAISKEEYMLRRNENIALLRGLESDVPFDPALRMEAIRQLEEQQERLLVAATKAPAGKGSQPSPLAAITGMWAPIGPFPIPNGQTVGASTAVSGRTVTIAVHPTNPDIAYVGTAQGGLYRTTNGGATWTPLLDNALSLSIGTVVIAPSNPEVVFVGTGEQGFSADSFFGVGLYRIENASSATPTIVGPINRDTANNDVLSGRSIGEILVHPTDPNVVFVGTVSGIGGIGPATPAIVPNRGLFRSTNAMSAAPTFTKLGVTAAGVGENRNIIDMVMEPGNPNRIICSVVGTTVPANDNGGLFLTVDALAPTPTFTKTLDLPGTTSTATRTELAINKVGGTVTAYAASAIGTGSVYRSPDGGQTWVLTVDNNFCNPQCFYDIAIDVDPTNANRVYLGGSPTLPFGISTNGGVSFATSADGLHVDSHVITVAPSNPQVVYFGSDGGIYRSNNAGATWTSLSNETYSATQFMSVAVHPTDPNFTIGGTQDNGTEMLRFDGTWRRTDFGDGGYAAIDQTSPANGATMYHTYFNSNAPGGAVMGYAFSENVNAFENWTFRGCQIAGTGNGITCTDSVLFYAPLETGPGTPNTTYYGSDRLYRSDNKGLVHTVVSQAPIELNTAVTPPAGVPVSAIGISPQNDNVRIVGLRNGGLWGTTTGSPVLTNLDLSNTVPSSFIARAVIDPNNPNTAYVTLSAFGVTNVWKTTSLTAPNWTAASGSGANAIPQVPVNAFLVDPANSNLLIAGTDIGVYSSDDGGANWMPVGTGLPRVATFDMGITSERKLRIATHGRGMWDIVLPGAVSVVPNPVFNGVNQVSDPRACDRLTVSWLPAVSANPQADIVYDIYRATAVAPGNGTQDPMFTPSSANRIQAGVRGTSFTDINLVRNQVYYYIVQARDLNNGRIDNNNTGNTVVKFNAPTSPIFTSPPVFANETFSSSAANNRFAPPLIDSATPNQGLAAFQRVPGVDFGGSSSAAMYAPNFDPNSDGTGAPSDFSAAIGPLNLTGNSLMEFDHFFRTEAFFDGGVMEIAVGTASFNATPFPDNVTTFDLGNHMIQNGYNAKLDGELVAGVPLSPLQGRRAFTGVRGLSRVRIALRAFAPGGVHNPTGAPVFIRFRMTSDAGSTAGAASGWYLDNVVVNNLEACPDAPVPVGLQYYPLPRPLRLLDTRAGEPACDNPGAPLAGGTDRVQNARVTCENITIPAAAVTLVGNATVVNHRPGSSGGFATLYPADGTRPNASNLNYVAGQIVPNSFVVGLGVNGPSAGKFKIHTSSTTDFVVDVTGYYAPAAPTGLYYHALARPIRLLDTRAGEPACDMPGAPLIGGQTRTEAARGTCGNLSIPASAKAIVGNATVVNAAGGGAGFVTLYPTGVARPVVSNLNYVAGQVVPNAFTVGLGAGDGAFNIYTTQNINFVVDVTGYYSDQPGEDGNGVGLLYFSMPAPLRLLDTRSGETACDTPGAPLAGGVDRTQPARVTCQGVTLPASALAIVGNATVVNNTGSGSGFVTLYPSGMARPTASNLNYVAGEVVPNQFVVGLGGDGAFRIYPTTEINFVVDIAGFFAP